MTVFDSANSCITLVSWLWSIIAWPKGTCIKFSTTGLVRRRLVLGCKISAASVVSMSTQWTLFTIVLVISVLLVIVHSRKRKTLGRIETTQDFRDDKADRPGSE
jgi:hypothetical protein